MTDTQTAAKTQPAMPPVKGGVVAYLSIDGAAKAAEFYTKAFGAEIAMIQPRSEERRVGKECA